MTPDPARSLTDRLRYAAAAQAVDPARLRRQLVFQRILARLARDGGWILKGGFSLETRLGLQARATRDLDLAYAGPHPPVTALDLQDALADALAAGLDDFTFTVSLPRPLAADQMGDPGWRVGVRTTLGGNVFADIRLDVVARAAEIGGAIETLVVAPPLPGTPFSDVAIDAVDLPQHAAEKVHAYARIYAHDRPSSRVKDLIDLALLIEADLIDPVRWAARIVRVFEVRNGVPPPASLPEPPASWAEPYQDMAADVGLIAAQPVLGWQLVDSAYRFAVSQFPDMNGSL